MRTDKNILIAFMLNLTFSIFEVFGGLFSGSVAIISDAIHDFGDAISIGISYFLEKKSKAGPDSKHTYGYARYSVLGAFITTMILVVGSCLVIYGSIDRIFHPTEIYYDRMILLAVIGVVVNFIAAYYTRDKSSINQKAVNLHMLEDVLGWAVVLVGSILMQFTNISVIDPLMSIGVALFILVHALKNLKAVFDLFLEKTPNTVSIEDLKSHIASIRGVEDIHHVHVWSIDGINNFATMHIVTSSKNPQKLKDQIREEMAEHGVGHTTIEIEAKSEKCHDRECHTTVAKASAHHHHHI